MKYAGIQRHPCPGVFQDNFGGLETPKEFPRRQLDFDGTGLPGQHERRQGRRYSALGK